MSSKEVADGKVSGEKGKSGHRKSIIVQNPGQPSQPKLPDQLSHRDLTDERKGAPNNLKIVSTAIEAVIRVNPSHSKTAEEDKKGDQEGAQSHKVEREGAQKHGLGGRGVADKKRLSSPAPTKKPPAPQPPHPKSLAPRPSTAQASTTPQASNERTAPPNTAIKSRHSKGKITFGDVQSQEVSRNEPDGDHQTQDEDLKGRQKSFHDELSAVVYNAHIVYGPDSFTKNFMWYERRCKRICYAIGAIVVAIAGLTGIIQYALFVVPYGLASRGILHSIFYPDGALMIFNAWGPVAIAFAMCVYGVVLIQYPKLAQWKVLGRGRWVLQLLLASYLFAVFAYFCVKIPEISAGIEEDLNKDLATNQGLRLQMIQEYYHCCGVRSDKDWEGLAGSQKLTWTGKLCTDESYGILNNVNVDSKSVCGVPSSCWNRTGLDYTNPEKLNIRNWDQNCLSWEQTMTHSLLAIYQIILIAIIAALITVFYYLRRVINFSIKHNIDLVPRYHFEECL